MATVIGVISLRKGGLQHESKNQNFFAWIEKVEWLFLFAYNGRRVVDRFQTIEISIDAVVIKKNHGVGILSFYEEQILSLEADKYRQFMRTANSEWLNHSWMTGCDRNIFTDFSFKNKSLNKEYRDSLLSNSIKLTNNSF